MGPSHPGDTPAVRSTLAVADSLPAAGDILLAAAVHSTSPVAGRNSPAVADNFALAVDCCNTLEVGRKHSGMLVRERAKRRSRDAVARVGSRRVKGRHMRCRDQAREKGRDGGWEWDVGWERDLHRNDLVEGRRGAGIDRAGAALKVSICKCCLRGREGGRVNGAYGRGRECLRPASPFCVRRWKLEEDAREDVREAVERVGDAVW